jgi:hypothetical protein
MSNFPTRLRATCQPHLPARVKLHLNRSFKSADYCIGSQMSTLLVVFRWAREYGLQTFLFAEFNLARNNKLSLRIVVGND